MPKPPKGHEKEWHTIVRLNKNVPFGYAPHPDNDRLLIPVEHELEALELAKRHLKQYSYRAVAHWLSKETGRNITHMGLKKRIEVERKRKNAVAIKRKLAKWLEETLEEIERLEAKGVGAYKRTSDKDS